MSSGPLTIEQVLTLLADTPPRIAALTDGLSPAHVRTTPNDGGWSANDVLAHLRSCADVWGGCIATMLAEDRPTLRAVNPTTWIKQTDYPDLEFQPSLRSFTTQRADLVTVLTGVALSPIAPLSNFGGYSGAIAHGIIWLAIGAVLRSRATVAAQRSVVTTA
ncbi:MAG: DinB family protein [Chloroflexota bacterium]|nr:DinB family protein [Chloroflexota bacterium]